MSPECQGDDRAIKTEPMLRYFTSRMSNDILSFKLLNIKVQYKYITHFVKRMKTLPPLYYMVSLWKLLYTITGIHPMHLI